MSIAKRILYCGATVAMGLVVISASAQQKGGRGFGFGGGGAFVNLVTLAAQEAVQKDLGVSGDTVGKLTSLRDDYVAAQRKEYESAGINPQDFQNLSAEQRQKMNSIATKLGEEFNPKVKELLSADQFKRLKQIQIQAQGSAAFNSPEVASELKLTDDQKKQLTELQAEYGRKIQGLRGGGGGQEVFAKMGELNTERDGKAIGLLNAEQKEKLAALKGSPFDIRQLGFGGRGKRGKN
jgi:hypothetical protein